MFNYENECIRNGWPEIDINQLMNIEEIPDIECITCPLCTNIISGFSHCNNLNCDKYICNHCNLKLPDKNICQYCRQNKRKCGNLPILKNQSHYQNFENNLAKVKIMCSLGCKSVIQGVGQYKYHWSRCKSNTKDDYSKCNFNSYQPHIINDKIDYYKSEFKKNIDFKNKELLDKDKEIESKEKIIEQNNKENKENKEKIAENNKSIAEKDLIIAEKNQIIVDYEAIEKAKKQLKIKKDQKKQQSQLLKQHRKLLKQTRQLLKQDRQLLNQTCTEENEIRKKMIQRSLSLKNIKNKYSKNDDQVIINKPSNNDPSNNIELNKLNKSFDDSEGQILSDNVKKLNYRVKLIGNKRKR